MSGTAFASVFPGGMPARGVVDDAVLSGRVKMAFNFVAISNQVMVQAVNDGSGGVSVSELKLHPAQEEAFDAACLLLAKFFRRPLKPDTVSGNGS